MLTVSEHPETLDQIQQTIQKKHHTPFPEGQGRPISSVSFHTIGVI